METLQTRQPGNKKLFTIISIPTKYFKGMSDEQHKFIFNVFYYFVRMSYLTPAVSTQFNPIELSVLNKSCLAWMKVPSADNGRVSLRSPARTGSIDDSIVADVNRRARSWPIGRAGVGGPTRALCTANRRGFLLFLPLESCCSLQPSVGKVAMVCDR